LGGGLDFGNVGGGVDRRRRLKRGENIMKKAFACLGLGLVTSVTPVVAGQVSAQGQDLVSICHLDDDTGTWKLITVAEPAVAAHDRHGDGRPGGDVPGMDGDVFNDECEVVAGFVPIDQLCEDLGGIYMGSFPGGVFQVCAGLPTGTDFSLFEPYCVDTATTNVTLRVDLDRGDVWCQEGP
jgi:hypothetical protein